MTNIEKEKCRAIIRTAAVASGTTGVLPILGADIVAITAVQTAMIISLGKVLM